MDGCFLGAFAEKFFGGGGEREFYAGGLCGLCGNRRGGRACRAGIQREGFRAGLDEA